MATYEGSCPLLHRCQMMLRTPAVEHDIEPSSSAVPRSNRPDLSTFFSSLELVDTSQTENAHAVPIPGDISAVFRLLADAFARMAQDSGEGAQNIELLEGLRETLLREAEMPPREVKGVSDEFLAGTLPVS